jgi:hypothetical protein
MPRPTLPLAVPWCDTVRQSEVGKPQLSLDVAFATFWHSLASEDRLMNQLGPDSQRSVKM